MVEARLDARLFGVKILRVDGTVLLAPGHLVQPPRVVQPERVAPGGDLARAAQLLAENRARLGGPDARRLQSGS